MTLDASQRGVHPRQGIVGVGCMVEIDVGPVRRGVARVTGGGETGCDVTRIIGPGEIGLVTAVAVGGKCGVVVVHVALRTWDGCMSAGQRKYRRMIERRAGPG